MSRLLSTRQVAEALHARPREVFTLACRLGLNPGAEVTFDRDGEPVSRRVWHSEWVPELRAELAARMSKASTSTTSARPTVTSAHATTTRVTLTRSCSARSAFLSESSERIPPPTPITIRSTQCENSTRMQPATST